MNSEKSMSSASNEVINKSPRLEVSSVNIDLLSGRHLDHQTFVASNPVDSPEKIMALSINSQKSLRNDFAM
jgi:hypothetical protein